MASNQQLLSWPIVPRARAADRARPLPSTLVTIAPAFRHESMPDEVALLLPTNPGPANLIEAVLNDPALCRDTMLGLFLAGPLLNLAMDGARLADAGVAWIANLPSIEQQDDDFVQQLADVGLDRGRELACLAELSGQGFRTAAVVADGPGAAAALASGPDVLLVLPRVAEFAAGFPSLRQRGTAAQGVAEAARAAGWQGLLLGLADEREAGHESLWPEPLDGILCRPVRG
ncbi:MAG: hypothetical protein QNJ67_20030 [Kiloniellales bacterium]|nr:hypothetical protein [Kiloniellales bacterium]